MYVFQVHIEILTFKWKSIDTRWLFKCFIFFSLHRFSNICSPLYYFFGSINEKNKHNEHEKDKKTNTVRMYGHARIFVRLCSYKINAACLCIVSKMKTMSANSFCSKSVKCFCFNVTCHTLWFMNYECGQCIKSCL